MLWFCSHFSWHYCNPISAGVFPQDHRKPPQNWKYDMSYYLLAGWWSFFLSEMLVSVTMIHSCVVSTSVDWSYFLLLFCCSNILKTLIRSVTGRRRTSATICTASRWRLSREIRNRPNLWVATMILLHQQITSLLWTVKCRLWCLDFAVHRTVSLLNSLP